MDNIIIRKTYQDTDLIQFEIHAMAEFISAYQSCYVDEIGLKEHADKIMAYTKNYEKDCYLDFGEKEGNYTPSFSLHLLKADLRGHAKIEVDLEIDDNNERKHRCCFYVQSELGLIEKFGKAMRGFSSAEIGAEIRLND